MFPKGTSLCKGCSVRIHHKCFIHCGTLWWTSCCKLRHAAPHLRCAPPHVAAVRLTLNLLGCHSSHPGLRCRTAVWGATHVLLRIPAATCLVAEGPWTEVLILRRRFKRECRQVFRGPSSTGVTAGWGGRGWSLLLPAVVQAESRAEL